MRRIVVFVGLLALATGPLWADAPRVGVVTGTVTEVGGGPLPGVTVQLAGEQLTQSKITGEDGTFRFVFVAPGTYTVRATLPGFQPAEGEISISAGGRSDVTFAMRTEMGEEVTVIAGAPLISRFDVTGGDTVNRVELEKIIDEGNTYKSAINFVPGVYNSASSQQFQGNDPSLEGTRGSRSAYFIDGVDASQSRFGGGSALEIPTSAVQELKVKTTGADAEYSRVLGGFSSIIIKSGTNTFRGSAEVTFQNEDWNSTYDAVEVPALDDLVANYDISVGGPIVRDQLWFFASGSTYDIVNSGALATGDVLNTSTELETILGKIDWRPSNSHTLSATYIDTPVTAPVVQRNHGDPYAVAIVETGGDLFSAKWGWVITDNLISELNLSTQNTDNTNSPFATRELDAAAPPFSPLTNNYLYRDQLTGILYNGFALPLGVGATEFPRDQLNASLNWFVGDHDIKLGVDYQAVEWFVDATSTPQVFGQGYDPSLPGGFAQPRFIRYYIGPGDIGGTTNESSNAALFIRDSFTAGPRWTFNLGLRAELQEQDNDAGETVIDSGYVMPRFSVAWDPTGEGDYILSASAGRYYTQMPQAWGANFNRTPTGRKAYDQYGWNPATQDYDIFMFTVAPDLSQEIVQVDPAYKDEISLGFKWGFHPDWAFETRYVYWKQDDIPQIELQLNDTMTGVNNFVGDLGAEQERNAVHLILKRRFRDNWMVAGSYTWSKTEGNCQATNTLACANNYGELLDLVDPVSGEPYSTHNRWGLINQDRKHVFKVRGMYAADLGGGHSLDVSGLFFFHSGVPWQRVETLEISGLNITHFLEPRGSRRIEDQYQLNTSIFWNFPLWQGLEGKIGLEVLNLTDEQAQTGSDDRQALTGEPALSTLIIQRPRAFRLLAAITF